ncbi:unnamed protein product [Prunus brigantina]
MGRAHPLRPAWISPCPGIPTICAMRGFSYCWIKASGHGRFTVLPELPVNLPLHHGCHVIQSILAPLCCSLLFEHSFF